MIDTWSDDTDVFEDIKNAMAKLQKSEILCNCDKIKEYLKDKPGLIVCVGCQKAHFGIW